jgi:hypothetical protein
MVIHFYKSIKVYRKYKRVYLDALDNEADKVGEDGQQVHHVQRSLEELPLAGRAGEPHHIFSTKEFSVLPMRPEYWMRIEYSMQI